MITKETVSAKLLAYMNGEITLSALVDWAENCFVMGGFAPDEDIPLLRDILVYLAAGDTTAFPLLWDVVIDFMKQLGTPVKIIPLSA